MKNVVVMAMALCSLVIGCGREDTEPAAVWRTVEPRLSDGTRWKRYEPAPARTMPACTQDIRTHEDALKAITSQQQCIADAIATLDTLAKHDVRAQSDLAAAYYVRAKVEGEPKYLLDAWEAIQGLPSVPEARFNLPLIQEALGFPEEAERSWDACQAGDHSAWGAEARGHRDRLHKIQPAYKEWPKNQQLLPDALARRDRATVLRLIRGYPIPAQTYLENDLIAQWAKSGAEKDLDAASLLADVVSEVQHGDPFARDVVAAITNSSDREMLRKAHEAYATAQNDDLAFDREKATVPYERALSLLTRAHSPLRFSAEIRLAVCRFLSRTGAPESMLRSLTHDIPEKYRHTAAQAIATLAYVLNDSGNHIEARAQYGEAIERYRRLQDPGSVVPLQSAQSGVLLELGDAEQAWNEAFATIANASHVVEVRARHARMGALAQAALALHHPYVALQYQEKSIELLSREAASSLDRVVIMNRQHHLSVALRYRAEIRVALGQVSGAQQDLEEALRLLGSPSQEEEGKRADLGGRIAEVEGQSLLNSDPAGAALAFSKAIALLPKKQLPNFRASLLTQRAGAYRKAKRLPEAEGDLQAALAELHREEAIQMKNRRSDKGPDIWSPYFERFQETYRQLVELKVEDGKDVEAFQYAERAKAFELLDLIHQLPYAPQEFRKLTKGPQPVELKDIQAQLPANTYLLEYCVLEGRTFVWIIGHDGFYRFMKLPVTRKRIATLHAEIRRAIDRSDERRRNHNLALAYGDLLQEPWNEILKRATGTDPRVVIIPDGDMRGLPFHLLRSPLRRYFLEDAIVSVDGSATLYVFSLLRNAQLKAGNACALLIGDPAFDTSLSDALGLGRLPAAEAEVDTIKTLYPCSVVRKDREATVSTVLKDAPAAALIHLAAHGVVNEVHPNQSAILLANAAHDDGRLDAERLAGLRLPNTRLGVLASCSSAGGAPVGPEGVAPLVRPFIGAGVPAIVGSLWDFPDATKEPFLVSFHRRYHDGEEAAVALRNAQLNALDEGKPLHEWAAFEVIGYAAAPRADTKEKVPP